MPLIPDDPERPDPEQYVTADDPDLLAVERALVSEEPGAFEAYVVSKRCKSCVVLDGRRSYDQFYPGDLDYIFNRGWVGCRRGLFEFQTSQPYLLLLVFQELRRAPGIHLHWEAIRKKHQRHAREIGALSDHMG